MTCSIVIKGWRRDRYWLSYCLRSLAKRAKGFKETVVILANEDQPHFDRFDFCGARVVWVDEYKDMSGYMSQQVFKVYADIYTDASYIFFADCDTFATRDFHANEFFTAEGKPKLLFRHYASVDDVQGAVWQQVTEKTLTFPVIHETMCSHPAVHKRETLIAFREFIKATHGMSIEEYVAKQPVNAWSEFNSLGAWAMACTPENYDWRRAGTPNDYPRPLHQAWSWAKEGDPQGLTPERKAKYEASLAE